MRVAEVCKFCKLDETGDSLVRTIAELAGSENIQTPHVADFFAPPVLGGGFVISVKGDVQHFVMG